MTKAATNKGFLPPTKSVSERMSRVRSRDTGLEEAMRAILRKARIRFQYQPKLFGQPDFLLKSTSIVVFCDSSFWHGRDLARQRFKRNREFWLTKLAHNRERDRKVTKELRRQGFQVLRLWDSDIKSRPAVVTRRLLRELSRYALGRLQDLGLRNVRPLGESKQMNLIHLLSNAIGNLVNVPRPLQAGDSIATVEAILMKHGIPITDFANEFALTASGAPPSSGLSIAHGPFLVSQHLSHEQLSFGKMADARFVLEPMNIARCVLSANKTIQLLHRVTLAFSINLFELLGLRNLSSFIGEIFKAQVLAHNSGLFISNPNQDGYPDLCALTPKGLEYVEKNTSAGILNSAKDLWSPYPFGGIEVKATCGNTPNSRILPKPKIGDSRIPILVDAEWKAHHQHTNYLLGVYWDFVEAVPAILAAFYSNRLTPADWGNMVVPKDGSRSTSVSIMKKCKAANYDYGVGKMGKGWIVLPDSQAELDAMVRVFAIPTDSLKQAKRFKP